MVRRAVPRRQQEPPPEEDRDRRVASLLADAEAAEGMARGWERDGFADRAEACRRRAGRDRALAEGIRSGALSAAELLWRPSEGPPSSEWTAARDAVEQWLAEQRADR